MSYYPVRLLDDKISLKRSVARGTSGATFAGRLGTYAYRYICKAIAQAFDVAAHLIEQFERNKSPDAFANLV